MSLVATRLWPKNLSTGIGLLSHGPPYLKYLLSLALIGRKNPKKGWVKSFEVMRGLIKILPINNLTQWEKEQQGDGVLPSNTVVYRNGQHHPRT